MRGEAARAIGDETDAPLTPAVAVEPEPAAAWFDYDLAFSRNIGWFTQAEQQMLRNKRVAIAGMGGVGGIHMLTLARLGIGNFSVADFDRFELANFNRQMGANHSTLGQPKAESVVAMAREINPEIDVRLFAEGVTDANLDAFLEGVDVYIDGLDFFVLAIRRKLFARARALGIPAVTAAPIGMGTGYLVFTPTGMSFEDYFQLEGRSETDQYVRFLMGLTPAMLHRPYLADGSRVDFLGKRGPSTAIACQLCAGVAATEAVKLMLGRGQVKAVPYFHHFDPFRGKFVVKKLRWGNAGPLQRLKTALVGRLAGRLSRAARPAEEDLPSTASPVERILDVARWTPSPDNSQPWRVTAHSATSLTLAFDLELGNPYQFHASRPNWLAAGMYLQSLRLAAARFGWRMLWSLKEQAPSAMVDVQFVADATVHPDPLAAFIPVRSVDRGLYRTQTLTPDDKAALAEALGPGLTPVWRELLADRWTLSLLNARATGVRLASRRCFKVHQEVIDWTNRFSRTGLPSQVIGVDPLGRALLRFGLGAWPRMRRMNQWLRADLYAGLEMDVLPGLASGAHVLIRQSITAPGCALKPLDLLIIGERLQRFWLTATQRGLAFQPTLAALFVTAQVDGDMPTIEPELLDRAGDFAADYTRTTGLDHSLLVFQGRLGRPRLSGAKPRSIRAALPRLDETACIEQP